MVKRHKHNLSHYHLTTFDQGYVVPVGIMEALPGDTFRHSISALLRVSPLVTPVMHPVDVQVMSYFVPNRLVWGPLAGDTDSWEDFITQNDDTAALPTLTLTGSSEDLVDRLGVPPTSGLEINALPIRAYNLVYNEFFRDEQITSSVSLDQKTLLKAAWQKDYFTTARPYPQQGANAEVVSFSSGQAPLANLKVVGTPSSQGYGTINADGSYSAGGTDDMTGLYIRRDSASSSSDAVDTDLPYADLSGATGGLDVNALWASEALQRWRIQRRS
jgi:hypothetical protein